MKMKLTKIVYDHTDEGIKAVNHYTQCADDDMSAVPIIFNEHANAATFVQTYTPEEWNDILYWIRSNGLAIDVVKAIDEVSHG